MTSLASSPESSTSSRRYKILSGSETILAKTRSDHSSNDIYIVFLRVPRSRQHRGTLSLSFFTKRLTIQDSDFRALTERKALWIQQGPSYTSIGHGPRRGVSYRYAMAVDHHDLLCRSRALPSPRLYRISRFSTFKGIFAIRNRFEISARD